MFSLAVPCIVLGTQHQSKRLSRATQSLRQVRIIVVLDETVKIVNFDDLPPWQGDSNETAVLSTKLGRLSPVLRRAPADRKNTPSVNRTIQTDLHRPVPGIVEEALYTLGKTSRCSSPGRIRRSTAINFTKAVSGVPVPAEALARSASVMPIEAIDEIKNLFDCAHRSGLGNDDHRHVVTTPCASASALIAEGSLRCQFNLLQQGLTEGFVQVFLNIARMTKKWHCAKGLQSRG